MRLRQREYNIVHLVSNAPYNKRFISSLLLPENIHVSFFSTIPAQTKILPSQNLRGVPEKECIIITIYIQITQYLIRCVPTIIKNFDRKTGPISTAIFVNVKDE